MTKAKRMDIPILTYLQEGGLSGRIIMQSHFEDHRDRATKEIERTGSNSQRIGRSQP